MVYCDSSFFHLNTQFFKDFVTYGQIHSTQLATKLLRGRILPAYTVMVLLPPRKKRICYDRIFDLIRKEYKKMPAFETNIPQL